MGFGLLNYCQFHFGFSEVTYLHWTSACFQTSSHLFADTLLVDSHGQLMMVLVCGFYSLIQSQPNYLSFLQLIEPFTLFAPSLPPPLTSNKPLWLLDRKRVTHDSSPIHLHCTITTFIRAFQIKRNNCMKPFHLWVTREPAFTCVTVLEISHIPPSTCGNLSFL